MIRAVVLAAGVGSRIRPLHSRVPKPLTPLNGKALISYTLEALAANQVEDVVVVTGYREETIHAALREGEPVAMTFLSNPDFELGAAASLSVARPVLDNEPFLLLMADHAVAPGLVAKLLDGARLSGATVAADYAPHHTDYEDEATKLAIAPDEPGRVLSIGKNVSPWQALDAGAFYCTRDTWTALAELPHGAELSDVFGRMAAQGLLYAADVSGEFWYDVDTPGDLAAANVLIDSQD